MPLDQDSADNNMMVSRSTLSDRAADRLREQILVEELKPGQVLAERELALQLGVSRTPLRDALKILATEGLVELVPNLRPRVANPSLDELLDLVDVLASLERLSGELIVKKISDETVDELADLVAQMRNTPKDGEELDFFKLDMKFHRTIVSATNNQALIKTHQQYNAAVFRARFMSSRWKARRPLMHDQHGEVVDMIKEGNGRKVGKILFSHLMQLKRNITELWKLKEEQSS